MAKRVDSGLGDARRVAVIDVGSNSIRLAVFDGAVRVPVPLFNEKIVSALGRGMMESGHLNPEGVALAKVGLARFVTLARAMKVDSLHVLGTAAVRAAADGKAFVDALEDTLGVRVEILTGRAEAALAALGVTCGIPDADGLMGDLGGGSLNIVHLDRGRIAEQASLPLGLLWLEEQSAGDAHRARRLVDDRLAELPWLKRIEGRALYPVGGAWRTLANISINQANYPLRVIDSYRIPRADAERLVGLMSQLSRATLSKIPGVSSRRVDGLRFAALLLDRVLAATRPKVVVFSANGMREGRFFKSLSPAMRRVDPLLGACLAQVRNSRRFGIGGKELAAWLKPLFPGRDRDAERLRLAACHLSDIAWSEHPDHRADIAFERILHLPFTGLGHADRAFLALSVGSRYGRGVVDHPVVSALLDESRRDEARGLGVALRLAYTVSGGVAGVIGQSRLKRSGHTLTLVVPANRPLFSGDVIERRLQSAARVFGLKASIAPSRAKRRSRRS